jgi:tetratricopeptide (TPR) repeat protein
VSLAERKFDLARASYIRALALSPTDFDAARGIILLDLETGHQKEAVARIEEVVSRNKPTSELLLVAGRVYAATGQMDKSEASFKKAIEIEPNRLQGYALLGQLYGESKRLDEATEQFREVLKRDPKSVSAGTMVGMLLEAQNRMPEAEAQYKQTLAMDSTAVVAANNLAYIYAASNRNLEEALQLAETAKAKLPDEPHVSDTLGWIYVKRNMASAAVPHLESSAKQTPDDPVAQYHLGMAYFQVGDWPKAKETLSRALKLNPELDGAAEARKALAVIGG